MVDTVTLSPARSYVEWAPVIAGAVTAAAISILLLTFGSAIGLSAVSPWPDSGLPWWLLVAIAAIWFLLVQIGSYAAGGYLAGRLRAPIAEASADEVQFRDGAHGFLVWALGIVISAVVVGSSVGAALHTASTSAATVTAGAAAASGPAISASVIDSADSLTYTVERLLRSSAGSPPLSAQELGETSRILSEGAEGMNPVDRTYLEGVIATRAGIPPAEATRRVDEALAAAAKIEADARTAGDAVRRAGVLAGFLAATALLVSAAAAALAGGLGGKHRDERHSISIFGAKRFW